MKNFKLHLTSRGEEKSENEKKIKKSTNQEEEEEEEKNENFIIDNVGDVGLRNALLTNDDYVKFEETNSDDDVQMHLDHDRNQIPKAF